MTALIATAMLAGAWFGQAQADEPDADTVSAAAEAPYTPVMARVRLTYYVGGGVTYSGQQTYMGSTACSWNYPLGTAFTFRDGERVVCNDRGMLGSSGWLDVFRRPDLATKYGAYATVEVEP